ncbi:hypothetical protein BDA99DRAFT_556947 [Phascolomyces articulosus]|uniref:Uncharacterized protein n=1 Tax=Phascolomyces articulosus TaxID=60185 RepID=A0AAD5PHD8_9FUNG|nr:hypothetical protein BDA99DRAFT_556947 [Phascolomyces articulosus]
MASESDDLEYLIRVLPNYTSPVVEELFDSPAAYEKWVDENPITFYCDYSRKASTCSNSPSLASSTNSPPPNK